MSASIRPERADPLAVQPRSHALSEAVLLESGRQAALGGAVLDVATGGAVLDVTTGGAVLDVATGGTVLHPSNSRSVAKGLLSEGPHAPGRYERAHCWPPLRGV